MAAEVDVALGVDHRRRAEPSAGLKLPEQLSLRVDLVEVVVHGGQVDLSLRGQGGRSDVGPLGGEGPERLSGKVDAEKLEIVVRKEKGVPVLPPDTGGDQGGTFDSMLFDGGSPLEVEDMQGSLLSDQVHPFSLDERGNEDRLGQGIAPEALA